MNLLHKKIHNLLRIAQERAKLSHDDQTKVGAVLVDKVSLDIIATGYNGFIRNAKDYALPKTRPLKYRYMIHAEANLIYNLISKGLGIKSKDTILFCTHSPCEHCARALFQCGITDIIFKKKHKTFKELSNLSDIKIDLEQKKGYYKLNLSPNGRSI